MNDANDASPAPDLVDLIGGIDVPLEAPVARGFAPWHRPRKQYVRSRQWLNELQRMFGDAPSRDGSFKYLSLPGDDLLDMKYLRDELCAPLAMKMRFLGFNIAARPNQTESTWMQTNLHSLKLSVHVDQQSDVIPDDIRTVANAKSISKRRVQDVGGFHAINLDLCDGFARSKSNQGNHMFEVLRFLIDGQSRVPHDSLLFITTRIDDSQVDEAFGVKLTHLVEENLRTCDPFNTALRSEWHLDEVEPAEMLSKLSSSEVFIIGLCKWVVAQAVSARLSVDVRSVLTYRVNAGEGEDDMLSIAIRLSPVAGLAPDRAKIAVASGLGTSEEQECRIASKVPSRVSHRKCVDDELAAAPTDRERYLQETKALLQGAGYDVSNYEAWAS